MNNKSKIELKTQYNNGSSKLIATNNKGKKKVYPIVLYSEEDAKKIKEANRKLQAVENK